MGLPATAEMLNAAHKVFLMFFSFLKQLSRISFAMADVIRLLTKWWCANNAVAVWCAYTYTRLGELLDCQTIMVMDYWASRLLDYKSYIGHGCYHLLLQAVCEALQDVVDIWTSKYWDVPLTKDFLIGLFWTTFRLAMAHVEGFPPSGDGPTTSMPLLDWASCYQASMLLDWQTNLVKDLQFVELYRTMKSLKWLL